MTTAHTQIASHVSYVSHISDGLPFVDGCLQAEAAYTTALQLLAAEGIAGTDAAVLHSNRAGARLMVGKPAAALNDALMAVRLDTKFFKAVSRAATCYCRYCTKLSLIIPEKPARGNEVGWP